VTNPLQSKVPASPPAAAPRATTVLLEIVAIGLVQATIRVWGNFTLSGFGTKLLQGLVVAAIVVPFIVAGRGILRYAITGRAEGGDDDRAA
jgi:hypothetical protein